VQLQLGILSDAEIHKVEQDDKEEGKEYKEEQRPAVGGEKLQVFKGDEPYMRQSFHHYLFASGHNLKEYAAN
jgi:hypothetical protein